MTRWAGAAAAVMVMWACDADDPAYVVDAWPDFPHVRAITDAAVDAQPIDAAPVAPVDMQPIDMAPDAALNEWSCAVGPDDEDADRDGLSNGDERVAGSDPCAPDSDRDGVLDIAELRYGGDVWDPEVGVEDYIKVQRTRGRFGIDVPFQLTLQRADIFFLLDATGSMQGLLDDLAGGFRRLVTALAPALPDSAYGVAIYRDYAFGGMGTAGIDKPFEMIQQMRPDVDAVHAALRGLQATGGGDGPESAMEALYQTLTGRGYDQDCDQIYDPDVDVPPFEARDGDPFSGTAPPAIEERLPGKLGGAGFRNGALKLIVYGTDAPLRDPDAGHATPGGCPQDAGRQAVIDAAAAINARLIAIDVRGGAEAQMNSLAMATGSVDADGQPMIVRGALVEGLIDVVGRHLGAAEFEQIRAEVARDDLGISQAIAPEVIGPVTAAQLIEPISFRLEIDARAARNDAWQLSVLEVVMITDDGLELARRRFLIELPPRSQ